MLKKTKVVLGIGLWLAVPVLSATNQVDAVTAATVNRSCKFVTPIPATGTTATVQWSGGHGGGSATFSWGTDLAKLTTRAVTSAERSASKIFLTGLVPNTSYWVIYLVSTSGETPYEASGSFKTTGQTAIALQPVTQKIMPLEFFDHSVVLGSTATSGDHLLALDAHGRTLMSYYVTSDESSIKLPAKFKGIVFLKYSRNGAVLDSRKVTVLK